MIIGVIKDTQPGEDRIALTPQAAARLTKRGAQVVIEDALGAELHFGNDLFLKSGVTISTRADILKAADILLRVRKPSLEDINGLKPGATHISFLDPFNEKDLINTLASKNISAISLEMIPRTTLAQKMDALSSQASLAGYTAVILAAERIKKIFPMMTTPAGTIPPARVFIVGAGVAGLQAIATAKRLGARVEAFDTRPVVKEQVQSLGAKFIEIDLGETGQTKGGYANALTPEQLVKQREGMAKVCAAGRTGAGGSIAEILHRGCSLHRRRGPAVYRGDADALDRQFQDKGFVQCQQGLCAPARQRHRVQGVAACLCPESGEPGV